VYSVVPDNGAAARQAVEVLYGLGHRRIAFWSACHGHSDARERRIAYEEAIQDHGLEPVVFGGEDWLPEHGVEIGFLLAQHVTAFICHNDERALAVWDAACALGLHVPRDLSIIGIDDIKEASQRGLTTFNNPFRAIGEEAVATIRAALQGRPPEEFCKRMPMPLMERASVASPKKIALLSR
jgi:DNA-binding LacI/PurR family transcriptional regulator